MTTRYVCWKTGTNSARRRALHKNVGIKPFPAYISSIRHFETREFLTKNRLMRHNWSGNSSGKAPPPQPGDVSWSGSSARSSSSQARPIRNGYEASYLTPVSALSEWPDLPNRQTATFPCTQDGRDEAAAWLTKARRRIEADVWEPERIAKRKAKDHALTFAEYTAKWLKTREGEGLHANTIYGIRCTVKTAHRRVFGGMPIGKITSADIERYRGHTAEGPPIRRPGAAVQAPPDPRRRRDPRPGRHRRHRQITIRHAGTQARTQGGDTRRHTTAAQADPRRDATEIPARHHPRHLLRRPAHRRGLRPPTRRHRPRQPSHPHPPHQTHPRPRHRRTTEDRQKQAHRADTGGRHPRDQANTSPNMWPTKPDAWIFPSPLDQDRPISTDAMREAYIKATTHRPDAKTSDSMTSAPQRSPCSHSRAPPSANSWPLPDTAPPPWPCTTNDSAKDRQRALADKVAASIATPQR